MIAASKGEIICCDLLLASRCSTVHDVADNGATAAVLARHNQHDDVVKLLIAQSMGSDTTCMIRACQTGNEAAVRILLERDATLAWKCRDDGFTPLMAASQGGFAGIIDHLIAANAEPNAFRAKDNATALMAACLMGFGASTSV